MSVVLISDLSSMVTERRTVTKAAKILLKEDLGPPGEIPADLS